MHSENNSGNHPSRPRTINRNQIPTDQHAWLERYDSWPRFHRGVRKPGLPMLKSLSSYPDCVLVAGCQRSGTTMLTRLIAGAPGFARLHLTRDDELDAALALAGFIELPKDTRYCFQTTYLNECFVEYRSLREAQRLIWVLRNPYSVVYSMIHNWSGFALNELYEGCGIPRSASERLRRAWLFWPFGPTRMEKACFAYRGKVAQILSIRHMLRPEQLLTVDYDALTAAPEVWLPRICAFADTPYHPAYALKVRRDSLRKADRLSGHARRQIESIAGSTYRECLALATSPGLT